MSVPEDKALSSTTMLSIYKEGLDDIININTLFTSAVFIGLSFSNTTETLESREECKPDRGIAKRLVIFEVLSFSFFLLSTLLAKTLKLHLYIIKNKHNSNFLLMIRRLMLVTAAVGTIAGCIFLTLSLIDVVQIRLGKLTCTGSAWIASGFVVAIFALALIFWLPSLLYSQCIAWKLG
ncbi:uncharacterized protein LOC117921589 [Vitis riparia]|uniref:uncharacterized protein LOC117921589 n=1 Tax=Vitis riparia TaxID=96939 RepID=UPI00155A9F92|nr:uncharacterized protein LOC117921589 [Vitis riparia]